MPYTSTSPVPPTMRVTAGPARTGPRPTAAALSMRTEKSLNFLPVASLSQSCFLAAATTATGAPECTGNATGMQRELHGLYTGVSWECYKICHPLPLPATSPAVSPQTASYGLCQMLPPPTAATCQTAVDGAPSHRYSFTQNLLRRTYP